jgi:hypothetical protein
MVAPGDTEVDDLLDVLEYIRARWNPAHLAQAGVGKRIPWEQKRDYALALARAVDLAIAQGDSTAAAAAAAAMGSAMAGGGGGKPPVGVPHHHPGVGLGLPRSAASQTTAPPQPAPQQLQLPGGLSITLPPHFQQLDQGQQQQILSLLLQQHQQQQQQQQQHQQQLLLQQQQQAQAQAQAQARAVAALQAALPPGLTPAQRQQLLQHLAQHGRSGLAPAALQQALLAAGIPIMMLGAGAGAQAALGGGVPTPTAAAAAIPPITAGVMGLAPATTDAARDAATASPVPDIMEASSLLLKTAATAAQQEAATSIALLAAPPFKHPADAEGEFGVFLSATQRAQAEQAAAASVGLKGGKAAPGVVAAPILEGPGPCRFQDDPQWYFVHCAVPWSSKVGVTVEGATIPVGGRVRPVLLVTEVTPGGAGQEAGVRVGDCVVKVEGRDATGLGCGELMVTLKELLRARKAVDPSLTLDFVMARSLSVRWVGTGRGGGGWGVLFGLLWRGAQIFSSCAMLCCAHAGGLGIRTTTGREGEEACQRGW